jgi:hypothetical protein
VTKRLLEPHLDTMANGQVCLRLAAETTWAEFDQVAPLVFRALNATLGKKSRRGGRPVVGEILPTLAKTRQASADCTVVP